MSVFLYVYFLAMNSVAILCEINAHSILRVCITKIHDTSA